MSQVNSTDDSPTGTIASPAEQSPPRLLMVAVDGSDQSVWTAQVAANLAPPLAADVVLVHVMDPIAPAASELAFTEAEWRAELRRRGDRIFETARSQFSTGVPIQRLLREGDPGREIVTSAAEWGADLLVMGTHGRGRLATFLLGSTAEAVIQGAPCPVLTVAHDPGHGWPPADGSGVALKSLVL